MVRVRAPEYSCDTPAAITVIPAVEGEHPPSHHYPEKVKKKNHPQSSFLHGVAPYTVRRLELKGLCCPRVLQCESSCTICGKRRALALHLLESGLATAPYAFAEPVKMSEAQLDQVAAGQLVDISVSNVANPSLSNVANPSVTVNPNVNPTTTVNPNISVSVL